MSLFSRLFGKPDPAAATPAASDPEPPVESPAPPDPLARAREEEASLSQAIAARDMAAVGKWVLEGSSTRIRQRAAGAIADPEQLGELIRAARGGNDKGVYRILTAKRAALLEEDRRVRQRQAEVDETAAAILRLDATPPDASRGATLERLEARWRSLAPHAAPDVQRDVARQLQSAREAIELHRQAVEAEAERQRAAARAADEARLVREREDQARAAAAAEQARVLEAARQAERAAEQAKREAEAAELRSLAGLLRQAQAALDHGATARAARLRDTIADRLQQAPALPPWFPHQLQQVDARLAELTDWKVFTVVPKRTELLQQMQSLIGADLAPEELARRIRRLRETWRTLHRGAGEQPAAEWQQFNEAATLAYQPCREYFARQAELRRENQARREALLERLASFAAEQGGDHPDWRAIGHALVEARREWRQHAPVDPAVVKSLQARFHELLDDLQARLDAEYARNVQTRRELVARAAELIVLEDTRQAIDEAKRLQRAWKTAGLVPWNLDRALWDEFRRHCDAVFQRSSQEFAAHGAALEANQARAVGLCEELERMAELTDESVLSAARPLDALRAEFDALELPRASARELRQRFARASERGTEALRRQHAAAERHQWTDLFAAAGQVRAYALATTLRQSPDDCEALRVSAASALAGLGHAPKGARAVLEQRMATVAAGAFSTDLAANEAALRMLCIRAELIADVPTPPEDLSLRREYQMRRLVASMARGERVTPAELDELALEWIAAGPVEAAVHDALLARFQRCREAGGR